MNICFKIESVRIGKALHFLLFTFLLICHSGCSDNNISTVLKQIEYQLEACPDSAAFLLDQMSLNKLSRKQHAQYAIFRTQADYKCYLDINDNSLIKSATDFYGTRRKNYYAAMAWYSRGCVEELLDNGHEALDCYLKAMSLFPDTTVRYYAMCLQNVGPIYAKRNMHSDAEHVLTTCMSHPACAKNSRMYYSSLYNLGLNELYSVELENADSIFSMILADSLASYFYRRQSLLQLLKIGQRLNVDIETIDGMICKYPEFISDFQTSGTVLSMKADAWLDAGQLDSAYHYYLESERYTEDVYTQCSNAGEMVKLTSLLGHADETSIWFERYETKIDSINRLENSAGLIELQHKHQMEVEEMAFQDRQRRTLLLSLTSIVIFGLLLVSLFMVFKRKGNEKILAERERLLQLEQELRNSSVELMSYRINELSENSPIPRNLQLTIFQKRLELCKQKYLHSDDYALMKKAEFDSTRLSTEKREHLLEMFKQAFQESLYDISCEVPSASVTDATTLLLLHLNFSSDFIADLFLVTNDAIRKRKSRLLDKLSPDARSIYVHD